MSDMINNKELFKKLERLQWLLHRQHQQLHAARGPFADPTRGQGRVLAILKMQPEISTKDLSYLLDIRQQSLSEQTGKSRLYYQNPKGNRPTCYDRETHGKRKGSPAGTAGFAGFI